MVSKSAKEEISQFLGSEPKPYPLPFAADRECEYWDLPAVKDEDMPLQLRYQKLFLRISQLLQADMNDPQIQSLKEEAINLLGDAHITKRHGYELVSINDLWKLDKTKGLRKEWWELRSRLKGEDVSVFHGYKTPESISSRIADMLILMPGSNPFDFIRINQTQGNNHPMPTSRIVTTLEKMDKDYGVIITFASADYVEFILDKPVEKKDKAKISQRLRRLCPTVEELSASIDYGRVALWWD